MDERVTYSKKRTIRWDYSRERFIPGTREIAIGSGVVYRPIRSWHANVYAGEGITRVNGDGSGCLREGPGEWCNRPYTVTHRLYWNKKDPERTWSVFLSYPDAMGCCPSYFWELYGPGVEEVERFDHEDEMEERVRVLAGI